MCKVTSHFGHRWHSLAQNKHSVQTPMFYDLLLLGLFLQSTHTQTCPYRLTHSHSQPYQYTYEQRKKKIKAISRLLRGRRFCCFCRMVLRYSLKQSNHNGCVTAECVFFATKRITACYYLTLLNQRWLYPNEIHCELNDICTQEKKSGSIKEPWEKAGN